MEKKEIKAKMDAVMKEAKALIKEAGLYIKGLKKKERGTPEYQQKLAKGTELMKEALQLIDEYNALSKEAFNKN